MTAPCASVTRASPEAQRAFYFKLAPANVLPVSMSETGQYDRHKENDAVEKIFHHCPTSAIDALFHIRGDLGVDDLVGIGRGLATFELVDNVHAAHHLADHGIFVVEEQAVGKHDEELAV